MPPQIASDDTHYQAEKIAGELQFVDGLVWSRAGFLLAADVRQGRILKLGATAGPQPFRDNDGGASGLAYDAQDRLYICESEARRVTRLDSNGKLETLADRWQGKKFNAPNDIAVRKDGHVYFTDPAFGSADDSREIEFYGVWHIPPKGEAEPVAQWKTRPNGIAFSADGKTLFVADSDRHAIVAFDADRSGNIRNQRDVIKDVAGVPGGIRTDVDGRLYVAAKGVAVYSAAGKLERTLIDSEIATNCAFGEGEFETLFIAARSAIFKVKLGVKGALQY